MEQSFRLIPDGLQGGITIFEREIGFADGVLSHHESAPPEPHLSGFLRAH